MMQSSIRRQVQTSLVFPGQAGIALSLNAGRCYVPLIFSGATCEIVANADIGANLGLQQWALAEGCGLDRYLAAEKHITQVQPRPA